MKPCSKIKEKKKKRRKKSLKTPQRLPFSQGLRGKKKKGKLQDAILIF